MADKRELLFILDGKDKGAKKAFDDLGDSADDAQDDVDGMRAGLRKLDGQLDASRKQVDSLRKEIGKSGDLALIKDLERAQREVNKLTKQRKLLSPGDGADAAEDFSAGFIGRIGPLMAKAPISPPLLAAAAGAAPAISSVVAGAVTLGIASGAVGAGILIASKDPEVAGAAKAVGATIGDALGEDIGAAFKPEVRAALSFAQTEFRSLRPELRGLGRDAAQLVKPFTVGVVGGAKILVGSLRDAVAESEPLAELMGEHLPAMATALGAVIEDLASVSESSADTLDSALTFMEGSLAVTGELLKGLAIFQQWFGGLGQAFGTLMGGGEAEETTEWADSLGSLAHKIEEAGGAASKTKGEVRDLASQIAAMDEIMRSVHDANISAAEANIRYKDSLIAAKEAADGHKKVTGEEESALLDLARASNDATAAMQRSGASTADLSAKTATARANFIAAAIAMGFSETKANELADAYLDVPTSINTKANLNKQQAERDLDRLNGRIDHVTRDRTVRVSFWTSSGDLKVSGGTLVKNATGGYIDRPGPKGIDSVPALLAPGEYVIRSSVVDKLGKGALDALNNGDVSWARQVGNTMPAAAPRRVMAVGHGGVRRGGAPFGWAGMQRSFISFLVDSIDAAGGDSDVLRIGRGKAA